MASKQRQLFKNGELLFACALCYIGLSQLFVIHNVQQQRQFYSLCQWITSGANNHPREEELQANKLVFTGVKVCEAILMVFAGTCVLNRKFPQRPLVAFAVFLFSFLQTYCFAQTDKFDEKQTHMLAAKHLPALAGCMLLLTKGKILYKH